MATKLFKGSRIARHHQMLGEDGRDLPRGARLCWPLDLGCPTFQNQNTFLLYYYYCFWFFFNYAKRPEGNGSLCSTRLKCWAPPWASGEKYATESEPLDHQGRSHLCCLGHLVMVQPTSLQESSIDLQSFCETGGGLVFAGEINHCEST